MKGFMKQTAKAFVAAAIAVLGSLGAALAGSAAGFDQVTTAQWIATASAGLAAFGAVYGISNSTPPSKEA
jgi:hypothetical protein